MVTGAPATGKSTLAARIGREAGVMLITKDAIKEPLFDALGAVERAGSRRLSDASFAVAFNLARIAVANGTSLVLEGNFRPAEHDATLHAALRGARLLQVLCTASDLVRTARLTARRLDPARHPLHADDRLVGAPAAAAFLDLPGARCIHDSEAGEAAMRTTVAGALEFLGG